MKITIVFLFIKQGSKKCRTIKALEDELSTAAEKYEKAEREVSPFDEQFCTSDADVSLH